MLLLGFHSSIHGWSHIKKKSQCYITNLRLERKHVYGKGFKHITLLPPTYYTRPFINLWSFIAFTYLYEPQMDAHVK